MAVITGVPRQQRQARRHIILVVQRCAKGGEGGVLDIAGGVPVLGVAGEGRVHYHQVKTGIGDVRRDLRRRFLAHAAGAEGRVAGVEQGHRRRGLQQFQGADGGAAVSAPPVSQVVKAGVVKPHAGRNAGQGGASDMDGGRHNIAAVKHFLHHHTVQVVGVAAGAGVVGCHLFVHR